MGSESEEKKEMLIIDGNAFYEIDLECVKKKKQCAQTVHPEKKTDRINSQNMKERIISGSMNNKDEIIIL